MVRSKCYLQLEEKPRKRYKEYKLLHRSIKLSRTDVSLFRRLFRFFLLFVVVSFLNGCMDYHEVESVTLVSGIGVIMDRDTMVVHLELIEKGRIPSEGEGIKTIVSEGKSFGDAIRNIVLQNGKRPYFGHTQVLIIDEEAVDLLPDIVNDLLANKEVRYDLQLVVARNAMDALFKKNEELRAFDMYELLKTNRYLATSMSMRLLDFMEQKDGSYLLPIITMKEEQATLREGALLMTGQKKQREVNAQFVSAYLMLEGLFESSVSMIEKDDGKAILTELNHVKAKYERQGEEAQIKLSGRLMITEEDKDNAIKRKIEEKVLWEVEQFLLENESLGLVDLNEKLGSRKLFEPANQPLPNVLHVRVDIDVRNASNVRRGQ